LEILCLLALGLRIIRPPYDRALVEEVPLHERCICEDLLIPRVRHGLLFAGTLRDPHERFTWVIRPVGTWTASQIASYGLDELRWIFLAQDFELSEQLLPAVHLD